MTQDLEPVETITTTTAQHPDNRPALTANAEWMFFRRWLQSPLSVASVMPSSGPLARAMVDALPGGDKVVVELGAGTGAITNVLLQSACTPQGMVIVERDPYFCEFLGNQYPRIKVIHGDALNLQQLLTSAGIEFPVRAVVSGLPLLAMPASAQESLLRQVIDVTAGTAPLIQFSYSLFSPLKKSVQVRLGLEAKCAQHVWRNVPPAKIWCYRQHATVVAHAEPRAEEKSSL